MSAKKKAAKAKFTLRANPVNPRRITSQQLRMLRKSMIEFGDLGGVILNRQSGMLVGGHQRTSIIEQDPAASIELAGELTKPDDKGTVAWGWIVSGGQRFAYREVVWDTAREEAAMIAANKHGGMWDDDKLKEMVRRLADTDPDLLGFTDDEITALLSSPPTKGNTDPDETPEPPKVPTTILGDVWILGRHRIVCGDSTKKNVAALALDGQKPKLMVTDPPYGVKYDASWRVGAGLAPAVASGKVLNDHEADWRKAYALFHGSVAYVWHAGVFAPIVAAGLESVGFAIRSQIIWDKGQLVMGRGDYHWRHEPCWYAVRKGSRGCYNGDRTQTTVWDIAPSQTFSQPPPLIQGTSESWSDGTGHAGFSLMVKPAAGVTWAAQEAPWEPQGTVWDIPKPSKNETGHSTQKPVECMLRPITNNSVQGDHIYEPFSGSGTTIIACEMSGRHCHAIELSPAYVDVAVLRWEAFTGLKAVHVGTGLSYDDLRAQRLSS